MVTALREQHKDGEKTIDEEKKKRLVRATVEEVVESVGTQKGVFIPFEGLLELDKCWIVQSTCSRLIQKVFPLAIVIVKVKKQVMKDHWTNVL